MIYAYKTQDIASCKTLTHLGNQITRSITIHVYTIIYRHSYPSFYLNFLVSTSPQNVRANLVPNYLTLMAYQKIFLKKLVFEKISSDNKKNHAKIPMDKD